jgi:cell division control protein 7
MLIDFGLVDVVSLETVNLKKPVLVTEANRFLSRACRQRIPAASRAGTKGFRAPEVLLRHQNQTCAVDIWSAGMIFLCLLSGKYPISTPTDDLDALVEISQLIGTRRLQEAAKNLDRDVVLPQDIVHSGWRSVLNKLEGRTDLEIDDCSLDLLNRLLDPDMYSRVTASEALQHPFFSED